MQGADNKRMAAIYRTQFKLLMRWCLLMSLLCFAVLIFLITARGEITSMRGYIQVGTLMLQASAGEDFLLVTQISCQVKAEGC